MLFDACVGNHNVQVFFFLLPKSRLSSFAFYKRMVRYTVSTKFCITLDALLNVFRNRDGMRRYNSLLFAENERQDFCADTKGGEGLKRPPRIGVSIHASRGRFSIGYRVSILPP